MSLLKKVLRTQPIMVPLDHNRRNFCFPLMQCPNISTPNRINYILYKYRSFIFPGLLLQGDNVVQLVVLCAEKPVLSLLDRVANELPIQLRKVSEEHQYNVSTDPPEGAVLVSDGTITVKVSLTSPLLREQGILLYFICTLNCSISSYQFLYDCFSFQSNPLQIFRLIIFFYYLLFFVIAQATVTVSCRLHCS